MSLLPTHELHRLARCNHRATIRYRCAPATFGKLYVADDSEYQRAWINNLSKNGVGLTLTRPLVVGAFLVIQMRGANGPIDLPAHVAHATAQMQSEWLVGCELIHPLSDEELDALL